MEGIPMDLPDGVEIIGPINRRYEEILSERALELVALLHRKLEPVRQEVLARRAQRIEALAAGTRRGGSPRQRRAWSTGGWRSPARPSAR
jgi:malate synthase